MSLYRPYFTPQEIRMLDATQPADLSSEINLLRVLIARVLAARQRLHELALAQHAALLTTFFPKIVTEFAPGYVFLFFCGMMVLQLIWVKLMVPETKGVPLEQIQYRLTGRAVAGTDSTPAGTR